MKNIAQVKKALSQGLKNNAPPKFEINFEIDKEYLIKDIKDKLRVGMKIKTNGTGLSAMSPMDPPCYIITGEIGEITGSSFYVWQNKHDGESGQISPTTKGYKCSWVIHLENQHAWIIFTK